MIVEAKSKGPGHCGLHIGAENVRRYFPQASSSIELQLGHLKIQCELEPGFWQGEPDIYDPRLCAWIESRHMHGNRDRSSVLLALVPAGENAYRLMPASAEMSVVPQRQTQTIAAA